MCTIKGYHMSVLKNIWKNYTSISVVSNKTKLGLETVLQVKEAGPQRVVFFSLFLALLFL